MASLPLWFKGLTPELRKYAEVTIGETCEVRTKSLAELRILINEQIDIHSRQDDVFLLQFLRTRKFDVKKALQLLRNYYSFRAKYGGSLSNRKPSDMKEMVEMNAALYMPYRLPSGSHVAIYRIGLFDLTVATIQDAIAGILLVIEMILECEATQVCGGVIIVDCEGMTFNHYKQLATPSFISFVISSMQDVVPERMKSIHWLNEPFVASTIYTIVKPLLKKKIRERLHFHGNDLDSLHRHIPKDYLPEEYGGNLGPFDTKDFNEYFYSQEEFVERSNKYGVVKK